MIWILDRGYIDRFINYRDGVKYYAQKQNIFNNQRLNNNIGCYNLRGLIFWFIHTTEIKNCLLVFFLQYFDFLDIFPKFLE